MTDEKLLEKRISGEEIFEGKVVHLIRDKVSLSDGKITYREVILHPGGVGILPLTEDGQVLTVSQYRYPNHGILTEIPAGKLEYGEDPLACGKRELSEEIGAEADHWQFLGSIYPTPAYDSEIIRIYLATGLHFGEQHLDDGELLNVGKIPLQEFVEKVMNGEIVDAKTQIAVLKVWNLVQSGELTFGEKHAE